ncbi:MAG TPA: sigma-54 dependent transcriptional regulator [Ignavibacteriaceae bacterium]|nr:sigma-54 dependent transcriptional regulator [Ignavibacteriaceae bacterium]
MKSEKKKLLIVDDEIEMLDGLKKILSHRSEFELTFKNDPREAIQNMSIKKYDLIITDLKMDDVSGLDILRSAISSNPKGKTIMISGYGTVEASVEAMRIGAFDFIEKPFTSKKLFSCIDRALQESEPAIEIKPAEDEDSLPGIIYLSSAMKNVINMVRKISNGNMNVLITGESGTGKELIARSIHRLSKSSLDPFVPVNCGALPEHLFESELFGHEKGAFTGAIRRKPGLLEFANHGTFFLDEIGELSQTLQVKLLRMLEERKIRRVGGEEEINIDVRIIAASNKDLLKATKENTFREDLYYRLNTFQIEMPPLRERTEDIILLAKHFMNELCEKRDSIKRYFSPEAEEALKVYPWPGNVRELQNVIGRAYYLCSDQVIKVDDLPIPVPSQKDKINTQYFNPSYKDAKELLMEKFEIEYLSHHLKLNNGNISKTAESCGIDRRTIHRLINKYNIIYKED